MVRLVSHHCVHILVPKVAAPIGRTVTSGAADRGWSKALSYGMNDRPVSTVSHQRGQSCRHRHHMLRSSRSISSYLNCCHQGSRCSRRPSQPRAELAIRRYRPSGMMVTRYARPQGSSWAR